MKKLICFLFGHRTAPGLKLKMSLLFHCSRCGSLVPGDLYPRRK